jgi:hypothetical protein
MKSRTAAHESVGETNASALAEDLRAQLASKLHRLLRAFPELKVDDGAVA